MAGDTGSVPGRGYAVVALGPAGGPYPAGFGPFTSGSRTSGLQEAIDAVAASGGGLVQVLPGSYPVAAPLLFRSNTALLGYGATLVNAGSLPTPFVTESDRVWSGSRLIGVTLDGGSVPNQTVLTLVSAQHAHVDVRVIRAGPGSTGVRITASAAAAAVDQVATTAASRSVYVLDIDDCATGLLLDGVDTRPVTNNAFPAVFVTRCTGCGVNIQAHADNNEFGRVHVQLIADRAIGCSIGTKGQATGSNHNIVVKLTVDCYKPRDSVALVLNASRGNHVVNLLTSGQGFARIVQAAPGATNFTVFNASEMVRYEAVPPTEYPRG
jgi:hypothetical protein